MTNLCFLQKLKFSAVLIAGGLFLSGQPVFADTLIDDFTAARNDRFTNVPQDPNVAYTAETQSFVLPSNFSLSGVGRTTDNGRWATLIGDNVFLSAAHFRPSDNSTIAFYPANDPTDTPFFANVTGGQRVDTTSSGGGRTDLYVGYLDRIVDSSIARYDFANTPITGTEAAPVGSGSVFIDSTNPTNTFQGDLGYIVGISPTVRSDRVIDHSVGLNLVSGYAENVEFQSNTDNDTLVYEYNSEDEGALYEDNEAYVRGGDSGAPNFTVNGNDLLLLGVNSFQLNGEPIDIVLPTGETTTEQFLATGVSYTGNQADEINRLILAAPAPTFTAVPEPSSTILLTMFSLLAVRRNKK